MKKNFKVFSLLIMISLFGINAYGQEYDCNAQNNQFRSDKDAWITQDVDRPFSAADISDFSGLFYYPIDCKYVFTGKLSSPGALKVIEVGTSKGGTAQVYDYGTVSVDIGGQTYNLTVYKNIDLPEFDKAQETIFIPIMDETSGAAPKTTFANGRYLVIHPPASGNTVVVDFNMAINPFENYNSNYPSLIVPASNVIRAPIQTGERKYEDR